MKMEGDVSRFRRIVRGKIKENLKRFISSGELIGRQGGKKVSIPLPRIDLPQFQFGGNEQKGVGQGDGEPGDPLNQGQPQPGQGEAGEGEGKHEMEIDISFEELADILGEELGLPRLEDKGKKNISSKRYKYRGILRNGPESLRNFKRTFKEAIKRQISMNDYDMKNPIIIPVKEDKRYRSFRIEDKPIANAVIIYMMDVSGSMGDEQKEIVRLTSFWLDTWLKRNYDNLESRYIIHDAVAREVDENTFYHTRESGGTLISSAYKLAEKMIADSFNPEEWNIYLFQFSDGDNWSGNDTTDCMNILDNSLLPVANLFCYGQVESRYGSGQFLKDLEAHYGEKKAEKLVMHQIRDKDGVMDALKAFLGKGK
jgi:uncharacterized sporulation protein YeaH/YhbH (DUF444 family)